MALQKARQRSHHHQPSPKLIASQPSPHSFMEYWIVDHCYPIKLNNFLDLALQDGQHLPPEDEKIQHNNPPPNPITLTLQ